MGDLPAELDCYVQQYPIQEVAPSAVRIADAIDAISCTTNLMVSFLVIAFDRFKRLKTWRPDCCRLRALSAIVAACCWAVRPPFRFSRGVGPAVRGFRSAPL